MSRSRIVVLVLTLCLGCGGKKPSSTDDGGADGAHVPDPSDAVITPTPPAYWYLDDPTTPFTVSGEGVTHFRFRIDDGAVSDETAASSPLVLTGATPGWHTLSLEGRNGDAWQETPTTYRVYVATTEHAPVACTLVSAGGACDVIIPANASHEYWASATASPPKYGFETLFSAPPGSTICLGAGTHRSLTMRGVEGTEDAPYTFVNCGGVARFALNAGEAGGNVALKLEGSHHVRLVGTGAAQRYGIVVASGGTTDGNHGVELARGSSDIEVAFVEVESANYGGIVFRTDVSCTHHRESFTQRNTFIHDTYVHDTTGEGFYLGGSHWDAPTRLAAGTITCGDFGSGTMMCDGVCRLEPELHGVRIYDNRIEDTDADGLQLSSARGDTSTTEHGAAWSTEVYRNVLRDVAIGSSAYNSGGMSIQGGTTGRVHHNYVEHTLAYAGLFTGSQGHLYVYDNIVVTRDGTVGIALQDNDVGALNGPFVIVGNTVVNDGGEGVYMYHEHSTGNVFAANLVVGASMPIRLNSGNIDWTATSNVTSGTAASHFADTGETGYHLLSTSSAVGAGVDLSTYGVTDDFYGTARVAPYDVGAVVAAQ